VSTIGRRARAVLLASLFAAAPLAAQAPGPRGRVDTSATPLEARVRQRLAAVVQSRLALSDAQMKQLTAVNATFEPRRRDLLARERTARVTLRAELRRGSAADQQRVSTALDEVFKVQRERLDVAEQEQRELAKFMQPSQRAGYAALQEQLRRRIEEMRRRRASAR
jgi:hypothetical protein